MSEGSAASTVSTVLAAGAALAGGATFVPGTLRALRRGKLGVGTLMTVAMLGAIALGLVKRNVDVDATLLADGIAVAQTGTAGDSRTGASVFSVSMRFGGYPIMASMTVTVALVAGLTSLHLHRKIQTS